MASESNSYLEGDRRMKSEGLYTFRIVHGPFGHMPKWNSTLSFPWQPRHTRLWLTSYLQDTLHNDDEKHKTHMYSHHCSTTQQPLSLNGSSSNGDSSSRVHFFSSFFLLSSTNQNSSSDVNGTASDRVGERPWDARGNRSLRCIRISSSWYVYVFIVFI